MPDNIGSRWTGWGYFGAILLLVQGAAQVILGASELAQKHVLFVLTNDVFSTHYFVTWGWVNLIIGVILVAIGFSLLQGSVWARVVGSFVAGLGLLATLVFFPVYPTWSIVSAVLDVFIIYALVVRSSDPAKR